MGLVLLAQASLPISYRVDAFTTTIHLMNLLSKKILDGVSPIEKLLGHKPDYQRLRVFRCLCYPLLQPYNRYKLQYKSAHYTFLSYALIIRVINVYINSVVYIFLVMFGLMRACSLLLKLQSLVYYLLPQTIAF